MGCPRPLVADRPLAAPACAVAVRWTIVGQARPGPGRSACVNRTLTDSTTVRSAYNPQFRLQSRTPVTLPIPDYAAREIPCISIGVANAGSDRHYHDNCRLIQFAEL